MRGLTTTTLTAAVLALAGSAFAISGKTTCHIDTWNKTVHLSLNAKMDSITQDGVEAIYTENTANGLIYIMEFKRRGGVEIHSTTILSTGKMIIQTYAGKTRKTVEPTGDAYGSCVDS